MLLGENSKNGAIENTQIWLHIQMTYQLLYMQLGWMSLRILWISHKRLNHELTKTDGNFHWPNSIRARNKFISLCWSVCLFCPSSPFHWKEVVQFWFKASPEIHSALIIMEWCLQVPFSGHTASGTFLGSHSEPIQET